MRRSNIFNKVNRNNSTLYNHINLMSPRDPEINVEQIWLPADNHISSGVQIVELNSSDNPVSSPEEEKEKRNKNSWIHGNQESFQGGEHYFKANEGARERRRVRNQFADLPRQKQTEYESVPRHQQAEYESFVCPGYYGPTENVIYDHQLNCFTIINKHFVVNSESSSENEYADIEYLSCGDNAFGQYTNHDGANVGEIINLEPDPDMQKRTVWIYSFKNRQRLNETDYELVERVNIPSCDTSTSSFEPAEELPEQRDSNRSRLATPIPPAHVPNLNLTISPKLPTVTEVSEPQKISSANQTEKALVEMLVKPKPFNNWFRSENATPHSAHYNRDNNTCIVNWLALSPRNRKRKMRHPTPIKKALPTVREVSSFAEKKFQNLEQCNKSLTPKVDVETQAEVHLESSTSRKAAEIKTPPESAEIQIDDEIQRETDALKNKERLRKLQIRFSPRPISHISEITEPIEKLDGHNWIMEENKFPHVPYYYKFDVVVDNPEDQNMSDVAGNTLLIRNMSLLKPAHWAEYLPITGSIPSLHLSMNTDSMTDTTETRSWFTCIAEFFRCCK